MRPCDSNNPARPEVFFERRGIERGGHDQDLEIGPFGLLQVQGPGQGDIAVEMALVEFVEDEGRHAAQLGVLDHLAEEQAFGDKADAGFGAGGVLEANLVADLAAERGLAFRGDARRQ